MALSGGARKLRGIREIESRLGFLSPGDVWFFFADRSFSKNFRVPSECVESAKRRTE
jgi:hypothetical protein